MVKSAPLAPNHNHARKTPAQQDRPWAPLPNCNENSGAFGQRACKRWLTAGAPPAGIGNLGDLPTVLVVETWVQPQISTPPLGALLPGPGSGPGPGLLRTQTQVTLQPTPSERAREAVREACDKGDITGGGHQAGYFVPQYNAMGQAAPHQHQERHQAQQRQQHGYPSYPYTNEHLMVLAQMQHQRTMMGQVHDASLSPTSKQDQPKPRLSKDEVDLLEKEFQKNHKPTSARKREIAELLKVDLPRINNWFQNRRAKEKGIKKTQEFAARQAAEQAEQQSESGSINKDEQDGEGSDGESTDNDHTLAQPSTAPFPADNASINSGLEEDSTVSTTNSHTPIEPNVMTKEDLVRDGDEYPSPQSLPFQSTDQASDFNFQHNFVAMSEDQGFSSDYSHSGLPLNGMPAQFTHDGFSVSDQLSFVGQQYTSAVDNDAIIAPTPSFPSQLLGRLEFQDMDPHQAAPSSFDLQGMQVESPTAMTTIPDDGSPNSMPMSPPTPSDLRFKSPPPPANLASRRNKGVPAQLNATALRSYSYGPKTGLDLSKRADCPSPIRRIASATGPMPGRIQKSLTLGTGSSAPRSPMYLERTKDALIRSFSNTRSPVPLQPINTSLSPMTPGEYYGMPAATQGTRENTVSSSASDDEQSFGIGANGVQPNASALFSTLKTPPGTPGFNNGFVSDQQPPANQVNTFDAAWNFNPQDEPLVTPGLGSFGSEEFAMAPPAPGYIGGSSQPPTPSYPHSIGPTYGGSFPWGSAAMFNGSRVGMPGSNTEYNFPESFVPDTSDISPSLSTKASKQFQFTQNVTPRDYNTGVEK
uniref:Homeobox domain-containing protein n=1 Tax=Pyricularia oryzae (strain P131) TaxID=1143193 RepID=L7JHC6_PYRO1